MEIKRCALSDPFLMNTIPPAVLMMKEDQKTDFLAFCGILEQEKTGYALFSADPETKLVRLEYLYTIPERRRQGVAKELLQHAALFFQKRKKTAIGCRLVRTVEEMEIADEILYRCGYVPLSLLDRFFVYESAYLLEELPESEEKPYFSVIRRKMLYVSLEEDPEPEEDLLLLRLSSTLRAAKEEAGWDFRILLQFSKPETFHLLVDTLGEPEEQYLIHDLCCLLTIE